MNARFVDGGSQLNSVLVFLTEVKNAEGGLVEHFFLNTAWGAMRRRWCDMKSQTPPNFPFEFVANFNGAQR